jgi:anti-sigma regulatory factor (Ser/Thr protein kinase)
LQFGSVPHAPRDARRALERLAADRDDRVREAVLVATSELVTNVVRHTNVGGTLRVWDSMPDAPLRVEVEDEDPRIPVVLTPRDGVPGGRGLIIVGGLSSGWGVQPTATGKIVWAEFGDPTSGPANAG